MLLNLDGEDVSFRTSRILCFRSSRWQNASSWKHQRIIYMQLLCSEISFTHIDTKLHGISKGWTLLHRHSIKVIKSGNPSMRRSSWIYIIMVLNIAVKSWRRHYRVWFYGMLWRVITWLQRCSYMVAISICSFSIWSVTSLKNIILLVNRLLILLKRIILCKHNFHYYC